MTEPATDRDNWWIVFAAGLAVFMASVDMSIVTVALPAVERDLGLDATATEWVLLAYLLPLVGLTLPVGRWLDDIGRRPALVFSLTGFAVSSVAAGLAGNLAWLIGARFVQGTFGALLFALVPALVTVSVRQRLRGRAMGLITTLGPLGLISGPALGGLLVDGLGWEWIFFVNVPVCAVVLVVGVLTLEPTVPLRAPDRSWFLEALLLSAAVGAFLLALSLTASEGPAWLLLAVGSAGLLRAWLRLPASRPVRQVAGIPGEVGAHLALASAATAIGTVFFVFPYFLQGELGASASAAGITVLAFPLGMALTGPVGGVLGDLWGPRRTALLGASLFTAGLLLLVVLDGTWSLQDLALRLFLAGCGNGLFNAPNMAMAMTFAPRHLLATTGASTSTARQLGFALGPAMATTTWAAFSYGTAGMRVALAVAAGLSALSVVALLRMPSPDAATAPARDAPDAL